MGVAYGIFIALQNGGAAFMPYILATIHDHTKHRQHGYFWVEIAYVCFTVVTISLKITLLKWDNRVRDGILQSKNPFEKFT